MEVSKRHESTKELMAFFTYSYLPTELQHLSAPCFDLAMTMLHLLPDCRELTVGLRKLLEAKDCFVRAKVWQRDN